MRVAAYVAAILACLVWADAAYAGYEYALTAFGVIGPGCCHGPPSRTAGLLALLFPVAVVGTILWSALSRWIPGHPAVATAAFLVSIPVGAVFAFSAALEVTPL